MAGSSSGSAGHSFCTQVNVDGTFPQRAVATLALPELFGGENARLRAAFHAHPTRPISMLRALSNHIYSSIVMRKLKRRPSSRETAARSAYQQATTSFYAINILPWFGMPMINGIMSSYHHNSNDPTSD